MKKVWKVTCTVAIAFALAIASVPGYGQSVEEIQRNYPGLVADGVLSYIYGYPLMMYGVTGRTGTFVPDAMTRLGAAPLNQFGKEMVLPNASFTAVVLPSTSTLYTSSFLNLCEEPIILHLPNFGSRFFLMQMLDGWTEVSSFSPGSNKQSREGNYALVGPACNGREQPLITIPVRETIHIPTSSMWIIGRIYTSGSDKDVQDVIDNLYPGLTLTPLSKFKFGETFVPPDHLGVQPLGDVVTPPLKQVAGMDACAFFQNLAAMMNYNLPILGQDDLVLPSLLRIGLVKKNTDPTKGSVPITGTNFDCTEQAGKLQKLQDAVVKAQKLLTFDATQQTKTGWTVSLDVGVYGRHYFLRAEVAQDALGANRKEDAVYGYTQNDEDGKALNGTKSYKIHFRRAGLNQGIPPVNPGGFWSLTIYDEAGKLVPSPDATVQWNAAGMPMVQNHSVSLNNDGSLDLYLQPTAPPDGSKEKRNWIPTPNTTGKYIAFLRMYWPDDKIQDGSWIPPGIQKN